jgi:hypothetical protein
MSNHSTTMDTKIYDERYAFFCNFVDKNLHEQQPFKFMNIQSLKMIDKVIEYKILKKLENAVISFSFDDPEGDGELNFYIEIIATYKRLEEVDEKEIMVNKETFIRYLTLNSMFWDKKTRIDLEETKSSDRKPKYRSFHGFDEFKRKLV